MDELKDQKDLTSVQCKMTWDRLAMYVEQECLDLVTDIYYFSFNTLNGSKCNLFPCFLCTTTARSKYIEIEVDSVLAKTRMMLEPSQECPK